MNEDELRAALHDGEGEPLDATMVLAAAQGARRQRRLRLGSALAAAVAVAAVGVSSAIAFRGGHGPDATAVGSAGSPSGYGAPAHGTGPAANPAEPPTMPKAVAVSCPARAPNLTVPTGSGGGPLFRSPVEAIKACGYAGSGTPLVVGGTQPNTVISGVAARRLVATLESASADPPTHVCPLYRVADARVLVLLAVGRDGSQLPPVTARIGLNPCNRTVTSGTAWRYGWTPPAGLAALLHQNTTPSGPAPTQPRPPGRTSTAPAPPNTGSGTGRPVTVSPVSPPGVNGSPVR